MPARSRLLATCLFCLVPACLLAQTAPQTVRFTRRSPQPGEQLMQRVDLQVQLESSIRQAGQVVDSQSRSIARLKRRQLTILQTGPHGPSAAAVDYLAAQTRVASDGSEPQVADEPVKGKRYHVRRLEQQLEVTAPDGRQLEPAELQFVQQDLQTFGMPNPLASFLDGRQLQVGQTIRLPAQLASELFGIAMGGEANGFQLKLESVERQGPRRLAALSALINLDEQVAPGLAVQIEGRLLMDVDSCQITSLNLTGPIHWEEQHGPEDGPYVVRTSGSMSLQAVVEPPVAAASSATRR